MSQIAEISASLREQALQGRAWPFEEARKLLARTGGKTPEKGYVLLETGYGPSGLPHIGTFGEVVRTSMVRHAFAAISDIPTRLFAFSDDMDGLRKVPDNIPNPEIIRPHLGKPLTAIPDPFGTHESFGHHNNARLRAFLDSFGFQYEFKSATECYRSGMFDATLLRVLEHYDAVINVILPTLGPERRATYSPFLPVSPRTGHVLQVAIEKRDLKAGTVVYRDPDTNAFVEVEVTGGACKLQWKADWAMRWVALGVDYEMSGKDLIDSVKLSSQIARALGARPPEGFTYELFLDEKGQKISKSKGNGLTVDEWLQYGLPESLSLFMFNSPKAAKRLHFDVIPRQIDDYLTFVEKYKEQGEKPREANAPNQQLDNPVWHIHAGAPPAPEPDGLPFNILMNLVGVANTEDPAVLWGFIKRYAPGAAPQTHKMLDRLVGHAIAYYRDFVKPTRRFRTMTDAERPAFQALLDALGQLPAGADSEAIQFQVYEIGKANGFEKDLRGWFKVIYEVLFGTEQGPRMGSFIALYGVAETQALLRRVLAGENLAG